MRRLLRRSAARRRVVQERVSHFVTGLMACFGMAGDNPPFVAHHSAGCAALLPPYALRQRYHRP